MYGEYTQGSLLYLALEACGVRDIHADHAASHIGKAAAIATVLRALPVHARLGQRYMPGDVMTKHGLSERDLAILPSDIRMADGSPLEGALPKERVHVGDREDVARVRQQATTRLAAARAGSTASSDVLGRPNTAAPPNDFSMNTATTAQRAASLPSPGRGGTRLAVSRGLEDRVEGVPRPPPPASDAGASLFSGSRMAAITAARSAMRPMSASPSGRAPQPSESDSNGDVKEKAQLDVRKLVLHKDPQVAQRITDAVFDLACQARAHTRHARDMAANVPAAAVPALLPAVTVERFLTQLELQQFNIFSGGLGPWMDSRPLARLYLQGELLLHTVRGTY